VVEERAAGGDAVDPLREDVAVVAHGRAGSCGGRAAVASWPAADLEPTPVFWYVASP
jgi:hypothetical protein